MECSGVCVWRHAKPPQSCWGVYFCKPYRLRLAITFMRKSLGACRVHLPGYRYCLLTHAKSLSFSLVGGERAGTPCLNRRHHIGHWARQDMLGHVREPLAASMPRKHAWAQNLREWSLAYTCTPTQHMHTGIKRVHARWLIFKKLLPPGGFGGPTAGHCYACSSWAADGWKSWHIPLTGDRNSYYLICHWVQREQEEPEKIKLAYIHLQWQHVRW